MKFSEKLSISKHKDTVWENTTFCNVTASLHVVILQLPCSHLAVILQSSCSYLTVILQLSCSHLAVIL